MDPRRGQMDLRARVQTAKLQARLCSFDGSFAFLLSQTADLDETKQTVNFLLDLANLAQQIN